MTDDYALGCGGTTGSELQKGRIVQVDMVDIYRLEIAEWGEILRAQQSLQS